MDASGKYSCKVECSYLQLYNEKLFDLLQENQDYAAAAGLEIREDKIHGVFVPGAVQTRVRSEKDVLRVLWQGARRRAISATDMNQHSSRSHTIFQIFLEQKPIGDEASSDPILRAKLNLVDLAGSETMKAHRASRRFTEKRISELTSINKSLSSLGNCVRSLADPSRTHIPYRDSKLTRLLQDSLGGNTKTSFVVTVSASSLSIGETMSTLQFADRAKRVVVHAYANEELTGGDALKKALYQIERLQQMLRRTRGSRRSPSSEEFAGDTQAHMQMLQAERERRIAAEEALAECKRELAEIQGEPRPAFQEVKPLYVKYRYAMRERRMNAIPQRQKSDVYKSTRNGFGRCLMGLFIRKAHQRQEGKL